MCWRTSGWGSGWVLSTLAAVRKRARCVMLGGVPARVWGGGAREGSGGSCRRRREAGGAQTALAGVFATTAEDDGRGYSQVYAGMGALADKTGTSLFEGIPCETYSAGGRLLRVGFGQYFLYFSPASEGSAQNQ
jgi:hypothetical protein